MWRKYPCVRQHDLSDCGAAALATISLCYGRRVVLQELRDLAGTDRIGTNLLGLQEAAEKLGFAAKAVSGDYAALSGAPLPAIAHIKTDEGAGHFVVLHRVGKRAVVMADPGRGVRKVSAEEFQKRWSGFLLLLTPDESRGTTECVEAHRPWQRLWDLMMAHRKVLAETAVCAVLLTLLGLSTSYFVQHLVDSVLVRSETRLLNALGLGMGAIAVFRMAFSALRQYLLAHVGRKIDLALVAAYARHVLELPMSFFESRRVGEVISRVHDSSHVREAVSGATLSAVVDSVLVLCTATILWSCDAQLAAVATLFSPLLMLVVLVHHPVAERRSRRVMENAANFNAQLVEDISGAETIKAYGAQRMRTAESEQRLVNMANSIFSMEMLNLRMSTVGGLVHAAAGLAVLWYGGHRVISGALTIGELMFFYTLLGYMLDPLERLATVHLDLQESLVAVDRLYQVLDLPGESSRSQQAKLGPFREAIDIEGVSFRYGCRETVLQDVSLQIPAGQTVAIVGESGCGKSTLLKLLMRFRTPNQGRISIDGIDLRDADLNSLRARFGVVSQEAFVFNGSIRENIALADPNADLSRVIEAARAAGLHDFISRLPQRYETSIGERGTNLSGGQRQRLAIARALLSDPDILLFDEATSQLDTQTEREIQEQLQEVFAGKTAVIVAHRLSTVRQADAICVMHKGRIVEQGTHDQLLAENGRYAAMWRTQTDGLNIEPPVPALPAFSAPVGVEVTNGHSRL